MEQNSKNRAQSRKAVATFTSLSGYIFLAVLIGMYVDDKFFNKNGISVIVATLIGILIVAISIIRLVIDSRDN